MDLVCLGNITVPLAKVVALTLALIGEKVGNQRCNTGSEVMEGMEAGVERTTKATPRGKYADLLGYLRAS